MPGNPYDILIEKAKTKRMLGEALYRLLTPADKEAELQVIQAIRKDTSEAILFAMYMES